MLPRLAAMVCHVRRGITCRRAWAFLKKEIAKGTKMMRDTSLVIPMEVKKQAKIKNRPTCRIDGFLQKKKCSPLVNNPSFLSPATIAIRQKSKARRELFTLRIMDIGSHGTKNKVLSANRPVAVRSAFFLQ